jgi:hypothetical protein
MYLIPTGLHALSVTSTSSRFRPVETCRALGKGPRVRGRIDLPKPVDGNQRVDLCRRD